MDKIRETHTQKNRVHRPSFFDYAIAGQGGKKSEKFPMGMKEYIPFEVLEALLIEEGACRPKKPGTSGRPPYPATIMLGTLFLQAWYGLSDPMTEELIHDRISFRKFLGIKADDDIPDETTICNFRNALMEKGLFSRIFDVVQSLMIEKGLVVKEGTIVDATLIHSSEPKQKRDEEGKVVSNEAADSDATYTSKRGQKKLYPKQKKRNKKIAPVRAIVELPFAMIKRLMGYAETRYTGIKKVSQHHLFIALSYNIQRAPNLARKLNIA